jgi:Fe-S oxidoreductase
MLTAFDFFLVTLTLLLGAFGLIRRRSLWKQGRDETRPGDWKGLSGYLFGQKRIVRKRGPGTAHLVLFWGLIIPLGIILLAQFDFALPRPVAQGISFILDLLGMALLAGTFWFLFRRLNDPDYPLSLKTALPLLLLLIIAITGFLAEGTRLRIVPGEDLWASPGGWLVSLGMPDSPLFLQLVIRFHLLTVLALIALAPFTSFRHLVAAPLNVYFRSRQGQGQFYPLSLEKGDLGAQRVQDFSWKQLLEAEACLACNRCQQHCPAFLAGKPLSPQKVIQKILGQMEQAVHQKKMDDPSGPPLLGQVISAEEIWSCTTCLACLEHCPVFIEPLRQIMDLRRYQVLGKGRLPQEARPAVRNLELFGDVQGQGRAYRSEWALNLGLSPMSAKDLPPEVLFWVGCYGSFHPRYQQVARALVEIMKAGQVRFGFLGKEEFCCGDPARRLGEEALFVDLARKNIQRLNHYSVEKIVTLCPHCLNTLKNEYPPLGGKFQVVHASELVKELMDQQRVRLKYPLRKKAAFHDPCYLGRANQQFQAPREILSAVPDIELQELPRNRENGFCCGGGGGHMWLHETSGRPINQLRAEEIIETGVELVGTACPYCLIMLEDGVHSQEEKPPPQVRDVIEIVAASLETN